MFRFLLLGHSHTHTHTHTLFIFCCCCWCVFFESSLLTNSTYCLPPCFLPTSLSLSLPPFNFLPSTPLFPLQPQPFSPPTDHASFLRRATLLSRRNREPSSKPQPIHTEALCWAASSLKQKGRDWELRPRIHAALGATRHGGLLTPRSCPTEHDTNTAKSWLKNTHTCRRRNIQGSPL